jgi:hypothetical protein
MSIHDHELPALAAFVAPEPFDTDCGEAWCSLIDPDIEAASRITVDSRVWSRVDAESECPHQSECMAAFASHRTVI